MSRRGFAGSMISVAAAKLLHDQLPSTESLEWGSHVIDCHFHQRPPMEANLAHLNGSGCQAAYLLSRVQSADDAKRFMADEPRRFAGYSVSSDITAADAVDVLTDEPVQPGRFAHQSPCLSREPMRRTSPKCRPLVRCKMPIWLRPYWRVLLSLRESLFLIAPVYKADRSIRRNADAPHPMRQRCFRGVRSATVRHWPLFQERVA
jgi:hypothetical protein